MDSIVPQGCMKPTKEEILDGKNQQLTSCSIMNLDKLLKQILAETHI